ncbi:uncharacterized protein LOC106992798 [Macaca mulatta]
MAGPPQTLRRQPREASGSRGEAWSRLARPCGVSPLRGTAGAVGAQFSHLRPSSGAAGWRGAPGDPQAIGAPPRPGLQPRLPGTRRPSRPRPHLFRGSFLPVPPPRSPRHRAPAPTSAGLHPGLPRPALQRPRRLPPAASVRPGTPGLPAREATAVAAATGESPEEATARAVFGVAARARLSGTPSPTAHSGPGSLLALDYKSRQAAREGRGSHARREALWDPESHRPFRARKSAGVALQVPAGRERGAGLTCAPRGSLGPRVRLPKGLDCVSQQGARRGRRGTWSLSRRVFRASPSLAFCVCWRLQGVVSDVTAAARRFPWALPCAALVRAGQ